MNIINPYKFASSEPAELILTNMTFDYDTNLGVTFSDTDKVDAWTDQSANAVGDLTAASTIRPAIQTNGNPAGDGDSFLLDGTNDRLGPHVFTWTQPQTIYLVAKMVTWVDNRELLDGGTSAKMLFAMNGTTPDMEIFADSFVATNNDLAVGTWGIWCLVYNGASSSIRVNNNTKTTGNAGTRDAGGLTIGSRGNGANESNIEICRVIGYDTGAHSDAEQDQNIEFLNTTYTVF